MIDDTVFSSRLRRFTQDFLQAGIDGVIVSKKENVFYLAGLRPIHPLEREAFLLITPSERLLYHSPFVYPPNLPEMTYQVITPKQTLAEISRRFFSSHHSIGIEKTNLTVQEYERFQTILTDGSFTAIDPILNQLRLIKDSTEQLKIKRAVQLTQTVMDWALQYCRNHSGITEIALKELLRQKMIQAGADAEAFPTIVAFDAHSAEPHHLPDQTKLTPTSIVLIDMGVNLNGYLSDQTRTFALKPTPLFTQIESIVLAAYAAAKTKLNQSEVTAQQVDQTARNVITQAGYGDAFIHTTGHGVGLEAHELPSLNANNLEPLEPGMVVTIEPGIYLPGQFGYRHEDTFIV